MNTLDRPKQVWVVIVTYNGTPWIESCILSVKRSTYPVKIVVVDNASSDSTVLVLKRNFPDVELLAQNKNLGFGQANNHGICFAIERNADFVFLLNQDTEIETQCIERLVWASERKEYSLFSPFHLDGSKKALDRGFEHYALKTITSEQLDHWEQVENDEVFEARFINAAAWFIPLSTLGTVGGFAPLFFHYGEDRDFVNRMHYLSLKLCVVPSARIFHFREQRDSIVLWDTNRKLRYYNVGVITRSADINISLWKGVLSGLTWSMKEAVYMFFSGKDFGSAWRFIKVIGNLVVSLPEIRKHRKDTKMASRFKFFPCVSE